MRRRILSGHNVSTVAAMAGVATSTLRLWEREAGWPSPQRAPTLRGAAGRNRYRDFSPALAAQVAVVAWATRPFHHRPTTEWLPLALRAIGVGAASRHRVAITVTRDTPLADPAAQELRSLLRAACARKAWDTVRALAAAVGRIHPRWRDAACGAVLRGCIDLPADLRIGAEPCSN